MKRLPLICAAALAGLAPPLIASQPASAQSESAAQAAQSEWDKWDDGDHAREWAERMRRRGDRGRGERDGAGARFMLRSGDLTIRVRCDPKEPMRACVDATLSLMDRARSPSAASSPSPAPPQ